MHYPQFTLLRYNAFIARANISVPEDKNRLIDAYEFECYTAEYPGGLINDGVFYQARPGFCTLSKPGQIQNRVRPCKGYYFNIQTDDPLLCEMFDNLPNYFALWNISELTGLVQQMVLNRRDSSFQGSIQRLSCVYQILQLLSDYQPPKTNAEINALQHRQSLILANNYIKEHLSEDLSLKQLAALCNLNPLYFHRLYVAAFGKTPARKALEYRLAAAEALLLDSDLPIETIASRCGFCSQSYFTLKFKEATGITPLQFRKKVLK